MILKVLPVGMMEANCIIVGCKKTLEAAIIDPGEEAGRILNTVEDLKFKVGSIILTHAHIDHIAALKDVQEATDAKVLVHKGDAEMLSNPGINLSMFMGGSISGDADHLLEDGDLIHIGELELEVLHTPGHTPGGICLYLGAHNVVITGDTLFAGSVGRSDFPGGNHGQLINSIKEKLLVLPDTTKVYPGHGPSSTIAFEKKNNPFL
ncbi:MAG TPA: MBL fold metallo-hydrolase [Clostridia bacterium]|nr:MBL fold metallo-hydrolase [Clostridia bacterium]